MTPEKHAMANASARIEREKYQLFLSILMRRGMKYKHWLEKQIDQVIAETEDNAPKMSHVQHPTALHE